MCGTDRRIARTGSQPIEGYGRVKVLDLFSGIGGFSLGLEAAGMETIAFCEIGSFPQKVLNKWWPSIPVWKDIRGLNFCLKAALRSFAGASPARIYRPLEKVLDLPESVQDSGGNCYEPFAWYDQDSQSWRTWQCCLIEGWERFSETWPQAGMMRNGVAYRLVMSERPTLERESGLLPTPTVCGNYNRKGASKTSGDGIITKLKQAMLPTIGANEGKGSSRDRYKGSPNFRGAKMSEGLRTTSDDPIYLNPSFAELVMGYPSGYTELATPSSQESLEKLENA